MIDANTTENWWGRIQKLHEDVITQWVRCRTAQQPFAFEVARFVALLPLPETANLDSQADEDAQREDTLARFREQLTWGLRKLDQFQTFSKTQTQSIGSLPRQWLLELQAHRNRVTDQSLIDIQNATHAYLQQVEFECLDPNGPRPVSEEYSAEVQLRVLHLVASEIGEPLLDIGCGRDAFLVSWLRAQRMNAIGIDLCGNTSRGCIAADWFEFPFVPGVFGTIVAHLSFSLQFLSSHLDSQGDSARFAKQYMTILRALRVGGRLVYVPGLPFIERLLPESSYRVTRFSIENFQHDRQAAELFIHGLGEDPIYTCHVERL